MPLSKTAKKLSVSADKKVGAAELPKTYDAGSVEDAIYSAWERSGFFNPDNLPGRRGGKPFVVMMPPPNATGTLHIGHAMFLALQDIMVRFARLRGCAALWLPGTDHAAIATNTKVEKIIAKEGKTKYDLGRGGFIERVEEFVAGSRDTIRRQIRKMGSSCDWSREAYTLDEARSRAVREMFVRMYEDRLIYRGHRIVNWCPRCESTLADDEVEYKEAPGKLYYIKYGPFVVATTRPETKLGDTAAAVHPDDKRYKKWIGKTFAVDFGAGRQEIRAISDRGVDMDFGTGVVGVTPAHSAADFALAEKNFLPIKKVIGEDGKMTGLAGRYAGLGVEAARAKLVSDLAAAGFLEKTEDMTHNLTVCYRCGAAVEPLTSRQWFVDVGRAIPKRKKSLKRLSIDAVRGGRIEIIPDRFEKVYFHWMENLRDWCISRQIWFGHRVPVWYCQTCYAEDDGTAVLDLKGGRETGKHLGIIASVDPPRSCPDCKRADLVQDTDTLDTWFSSGTWTFSALGWPEKTRDLRRFHPTQVLETGYDILFFWVARMILMSTYALGEPPFKRVYLHGLVRDEHGRKMSKSLENIIDPLDVAEKYGTDAVRLSLVIGNTAGNDLRMSEEKIAYFRNFTNKLWNIARFVLMTAGGAGAGSPRARPSPKTLADRWIYGRLDEVIRGVTRDLESLNFSRAGETLRDFTWNEFADWYLEIAKIEKGKEAILLSLLADILKLWHPFTPFVTEEIYRRSFAASPEDFLMVARWPAAAGRKGAASSAADFGLLADIVTAIRTMRSSYRIEPGKMIDAALHAGKKAALLKKYAATISGLARVGRLEIAASGKRPPQSAAAVVRGAQVFIPLGGIIDIAAERGRLAKELTQAEAYLAGLEKNLANADFVRRAPPPVVAAERQKSAAQKETVARLRDQLSALS